MCQRLPHLGQIGAVRNGNGDGDAPRLAGGKVCDLAANDKAVGQHDVFIIRRYEHGKHHIDTLYRAAALVRLDIIAHLKRAGEEKDHARCEIG